MAKHGRCVGVGKCLGIYIDISSKYSLQIKNPMDLSLTHQRPCLGPAVGLRGVVGTEYVNQRQQVCAQTPS